MNKPPNTSTSGGHKASVPSVPAPSQFLPGTNTQFAWDSTCLDAFKRCPRYYYYAYIEGWVPKDDNIHLRFGQEYHQALHDYELAKAEGEKHEQALRTTVHLLLTRIYSWDPNTDTKAGKYKNPSSLVRTVIWYLDQFKNDSAETVILANGKPALEVSFKWELKYGPEAADEDEATCRAREQGNFDTVSHIRQPYVLCGHLDRLVIYSGHQFVMDRKTTTSSLSEYYFSGFEPNNQMMLYAISSQIVIHSPVKGVIIDAASIQIEESRFQRHVTYRTPAQFDEWLDDLKTLLAEAERCSTTGKWRQNDTACTMYGGCRFRKVCSRSPQVRDRFLEADFVKLDKSQRWNPLKSR